MERYWEPKTQVMVKSAFAHIGLILLWIGVSLGLSQLEQTGRVFDLAAVLQCKTLAVVLLFIGRCLLFPHYRQTGSVRWIFRVLALGIGAGGILKVPGQGLGWGYAALAAADVLLWAGVLALLFETVAALYNHWYAAFRAEDPGEAILLWRSFWRDSLQFGIWLSLLFTLCFYYMINFYRLDVVFYSWFFMMLLVLAQLGFWGMSYWQYSRRMRSELAQMDQQLYAYLQWRDLEANLFLEELPRYYYLFLTREVLVRRLWPILSYPVLLTWCACAVFLLSLPQLIGIVIKV